MLLARLRKHEESTERNEKMARRSRSRPCFWRSNLLPQLMNSQIQTPRKLPVSHGVFLFWQDPLCITSWAVYILNRFLLAPHFGTQIPFLREHLDDLLLVPAALPAFLWARQMLGLRRESGHPTWREIVLLTFLASVLFEWLGPRFLGHSVGDWDDVAVYWIGAILSGLWWNRKSTA